MTIYPQMLCFILFWITREMACLLLANFTSQHLVKVPSIPGHIPLNTEELVLTENRITAVSSDEFEGLYQLFELDLSFNFLTVFPNLSSIAETLHIFKISSNELSIIPAQHLDVLTKVERLFINSNNLASIPDVVGPSNSLRYFTFGWNNFQSFPSLQNLGKSLSSLYIRGNSIIEIHAADLMLGKLKKLYADSNQLKSMPVICGTQIEHIGLPNNPLVCDKCIAWMLTEGISIDGTCTSPEHLKGRPVDSLSHSDLGITAGECHWDMPQFYGL